MLILKYHLSEEEFYDYLYYTEWGAPFKKGYRIRYYNRVFLLYAGIAALYLFTNHSSQILVDIVIFSVIAVLYFLMVPWLIKRSVRRRVRDILELPENSHVLQESEVILMDTGIIDRDNASETRYNWEAIVRKAETGTSYYLYTNSHHAIVIPKRALGNAPDKLELERLFNTHLSLSTEFADR
jgi:hypothetical protein